MGSNPTEAPYSTLHVITFTKANAQRGYAGYLQQLNIHARVKTHILWPNSRALATAGLVYDHRLISKRMLALEKTSLTRENKIDESRLAAATSKDCRDSGRGSARKPR